LALKSGSISASTKDEALQTTEEAAKKLLANPVMENSLLKSKI